MDQDEEECTRLQEEEILAMEAIYDDHFKYSFDNDLLKGTLSISFEFDDEKLVILHSLDTDTPIRITYMPPILIHWGMPRLYPLYECLDLSFESIWWQGFMMEEKDDISLYIQKRIYSEWVSSKQAILYIIKEIVYDHISSLFPLNLMNMEYENSQFLLDYLINYNNSRIYEIFSQSRFKCGICLEEKKGKICRRLIACGHIFCKECIENYLTMLIREGSYNHVKCPDPGCINCPRRLIKQEILEIVGEINLKRLEFLEEKARIEADPTFTFCPRSSCGGPVKCDPSYEKLGVCDKCAFAYCLYCKKTWHGNYRYCTMDDMGSIIRKYNEGDDIIRKNLEKQYGEKTLVKLIREYEQEKLSENWKKENSTSCPTCQAPVVKSLGCNHMICPVCQSHFCFLCGSYLHPRQPYIHYNQEQSPCYNRLFEGAGDEELLLLDAL